MEKVISTDLLEKRAKIAGYDRRVSMAIVKYATKIIQRYLKGTEDILEMGPAEGIMTDILAPNFENYEVVDAVREYCESISDRHKHVKTAVSLFECYLPTKKFDVILLSGVLDAIVNPELLLDKCKSWLKQDGIVIGVVANSHSLHRQAAVLMNILEKEDAFGEANYLMGHQRIYNKETFLKLFRERNFEIEAFGGFWLKPVSDSQIEECWTEEMVSAFMQMGEWYPEVAAELYIIARKKDSAINLSKNGGK